MAGCAKAGVAVARAIVRSAILDMVVILLVRADQTALNEKRGGAVGAMRQPARSDRPVRADSGSGQDGWALADNDEG